MYESHEIRPSLPSGLKCLQSAMFQLTCITEYQINIQHTAGQYICVYMLVQGLYAGHNVSVC